MISNYETNGVLTKKVINYQAANVASSADLGQKELTLVSSSSCTAAAAAYPDSASFYPYSYLKRDDRSDQENDEFCSSTHLLNY